MRSIKVGVEGMEEFVMGNGCVFCEMIGGRREAWTVYEDDVSFVFLDNRPLFPGHCLLVPKKHVETIWDLPVELLTPLFNDVQLVARGVKSAMKSQGIFIGINNIISQSVPHLHIHIVPRNRGDGLKGFFWPRHPYSSDKERKKVQKAVMQAIEEIVKEQL